MTDGLLLVDKPAGCTSHDVVQRVRGILGQRKIGHCGTLDPDATGLLLLTLGKATRLTRFFIPAPKVYEGEIRFGVETDTYDAAGEVVAERSAEGLDEAEIRRIMESFEGPYEQTTPPYSAKKIKGEKYYELARRGEEVPEDKRTITVFELRATGPLDGDRIPFRLSCSSGTYARSLAHDLGRRLGCGGHLGVLRRRRIGPFRVEDAISLDELEARRKDELDTGPALIDLDAVELPFPEVVADAQQEHRITHGQTILLRDLDGEEGDWIRVSDRRHRLLAVGIVAERFGPGGVAVIQPKIVFR